MVKAQSRGLREDCLLMFAVMCDGAAGSRWFLLPQAHSLSWGELASQVHCVRTHLRWGLTLLQIPLLSLSQAGLSCFSATHNPNSLINAPCNL